MVSVPQGFLRHCPWTITSHRDHRFSRHYQVRVAIPRQHRPEAIALGFQCDSDRRSSFNRWFDASQLPTLRVIRYNQLSISRQRRLHTLRSYQRTRSAFNIVAITDFAVVAGLADPSSPPDRDPPWIQPPKAMRRYSHCRGAHRIPNG